MSYTGGSYSAGTIFSYGYYYAAAPASLSTGTPITIPSAPTGTPSGAWTTGGRGSFIILPGKF